MEEEIDGKASGDVEVEPKAEPLEPEFPEPIKVPDVELIVDGFGLMPRSRESQSHVKTKRSSKDLKEILSPQDQRGSCCTSSSNIDIVRRYTWKTKNRMTVQIITYGATITSIQVPDRKGVPDDVIAGFDTLEDYFQPRNPYFGATIGRYASYINDATMNVKPSGRMYMLSANKGRHHYNGGFVGFDKVNWRSYVDGNKVIMSHISDRFSEGYPGTVMAQVTFEVTCDNTIRIEMKCTTTEPTIVNLSNTPYFNLAGHRAGSEAMYEHIVTINADKYTAVDEEGMVTGEKKVVGGTAYDFRIPRSLKVMLPKMPLGGYDVNFCVTQGTEQDLSFHARALHPSTGRVLEVYSNQPGLQFYTGNLLPDPEKIIELPNTNGEEEEHENEKMEAEMNESETESEGESEEAGEHEEESQGIERYGYVPLIGKQGTSYNKHGLFCMFPQNYPDAVNHSNFPNSVLNPGEVYIHRIQYKFGLLLGKYV